MAPPYLERGVPSRFPLPLLLLPRLLLWLVLLLLLRLLRLLLLVLAGLKS